MQKDYILQKGGLLNRSCAIPLESETESQGNSLAPPSLYFHSPRDLEEEEKEETPDQESKEVIGHSSRDYSDEDNPEENNGNSSSNYGYSPFKLPTPTKSNTRNTEKPVDSFQLSKTKQEDNKGIDSGTSDDQGTAPNGLPNALKNKLEQKMGYDFSKLKIHKNSKKPKEVGAYAFAQGNEVHFAPGKFKPYSRKGQELIGHELAHVIQQNEGKVRKTKEVKGYRLNDDKKHEKQADAIGKAVVNDTQNKNAKNDKLRPLSSSPQRVVQRNEIEDDGGSGSGVVPPIKLFNKNLDIPLENITQIPSVALDLTLVNGVKAKRFSAFIDEGKFEEGFLLIESNKLPNVNFKLKVNSEGDVEPALLTEGRIFGFNVLVGGSIVSDGLEGSVNILLPAGSEIISGLETTKGSVSFNFGDSSPVFTGDLGIKTSNGIAEGNAQLNLNSRTKKWSGNASLTLLTPDNVLKLPPGIDIDLPNDISFEATFSTDHGLKVNGDAPIVINVTGSVGNTAVAGSATLAITIKNNEFAVLPQDLQLIAVAGLTPPGVIESVISNPGSGQANQFRSEVDGGAIISVSFKDTGEVEKIMLDAKGGLSSKIRRIAEFAFTGQAKLSPFAYAGLFHLITKGEITLTTGKRFSTSITTGSQFFVSTSSEGLISNIDAGVGIDFKEYDDVFARMKHIGVLNPNNGWSLSSKVDLLKTIEITSAEEHGFGLSVLPTSSLGVTLENGSLTSIDGTLGILVDDEIGNLLEGEIAGSVALSAHSDELALQSASAKATLVRDLAIDIGAGAVTFLSGNSVNAGFQNGKLSEIGGSLSAVYEDDNNTRINIDAVVDYDIANNNIRKLDAGLAMDGNLFLFGLTLSNFSGGLSIRDNELISLGGKGSISGEISNVTLEGEIDIAWISNEGESYLVGGGELDFYWFGDSKDGDDRYVAGSVSAQFDKESYFIHGEVEMNLMKGLTGAAGVTMDEKEGPIISASIAYQNTLIEADELWSFDWPFEVQIPIGIGTINIGLLVEAYLNTLPLLVYGALEIEDWKLESQDSPIFSVGLGASWGLDFGANILGFIELALGVEILNLTAGIRAGLGIHIPIRVNPEIWIHGDGSDIWGEIGFLLTIEPLLELLVQAYLEWNVLGLWDGEFEQTFADQPLGNLGDVEIGGTFTFGDKKENKESTTANQEKVEPTANPIPAPLGLKAEDSSKTESKKDPESEMGVSGLADQLTAPSKDSGEGETSANSLKSKIDEFSPYIEGVKACLDIVEMFSGAVNMVKKWGIFGYIYWRMTNDINQEELDEKQRTVNEFKQALITAGIIQDGSFLSKVLDLLSGQMTFWGFIWSLFLNWVDPNRGNRKIVDGGHHMKMDIQERSGLCSSLMDKKVLGGEKAEGRLIQILKDTQRKEGMGAVREIINRSGGIRRWDDEVDNDWGWGSDDNDELWEIIHTLFDEETNTDKGGAVYTPEPGVLIERKSRSNEQIATEAFGHESYAIYLPNTSGSTVQIPEWEELPGIAKSKFKATRYAIGSTIDYSHRFETFEFLAEVVYGDKALAKNLKVLNQSVFEKEVTETNVIDVIYHYTDNDDNGGYDYDDYYEEFEVEYITETVTFMKMEEGASIILPTVEELGPSWIEVDPKPVGSTGLSVKVGRGTNNVPVMLLMPTNNTVLDLAGQASAIEGGEDAGQQLTLVATFSDKTTQQEAESAVAKATTLIDYLLTSGILSIGLGGDENGTVPLEDAKPGDIVEQGHHALQKIADLIYQHQERAAWITAATEQNYALTDDDLLYLPTWNEMHGLDALPASERGVAPNSKIEAQDSDSWAALSVKAYSTWEKAVALSEYNSNDGLELKTGAIVSLPDAQELTSSLPENDSDLENENENTNENDSDPKGTIDDREFKPGTQVEIREGDTWSAIAEATYGDFSLFVRLANHPANKAVKTLPPGELVTLPTLEELMEVSEFGLGLSPNGYPLMTEMVRITCMDGLHHVWVEDRSEGEEQPQGVWMMASKEFELKPAIAKGLAESANAPDLYAKYQTLNEKTNSEHTTENIKSNVAEPTRDLVNAGGLGFEISLEGSSLSEEMYTDPGWEDVNEIGLVHRDTGANIKIAPSEFALIVKHLNQNETVQILRHNPITNWYGVVADDGEIGYVREWSIQRESEVDNEWNLLEKAAFGASFNGGILHGAFDGLLALVKGVLDLIWGAIKSIFRGTIWGDLKNLWEMLKEIDLQVLMDLFFGWMGPWIEKSKSDNPFVAGHAYGYMIGRIMFEIISLFAGGAGAAAKLASLAGKLGKLKLVEKIGNKINKATGKVKEGLDQLKKGTVPAVVFKVNSALREKILWGINTTGNKVKGGHFRGIIGHPNYVTEIIGMSTVNPSCEIVKYVKALPGNRLGKIKRSTMFPKGWSKNDIIKAIEEIANNPTTKTPVPGSPDKFFLQGKVRGITIEVITVGDKITSAYPL